ncbi:uncharacterized protein LY89DRAFT_671506 [Mollisia scopiformis]|uniref:Uncharacterized protein n=1 Tax=Mollisia scopiformis TaxID=149040 RepID=A0A194X1Q8_MOLSC|nr:uncharacterized protein LY89DRAFT_671506 [Mollisia scopiformis]KUJ14130.1 hypothetical protein LY89DRAFT_671506 [Mollisia scopiformis]
MASFNACTKKGKDKVTENINSEDGINDLSYDGVFVVDERAIDEDGGYFDDEDVEVEENIEDVESSKYGMMAIVERSEDDLRPWEKPLRPLHEYYYGAKAARLPLLFQKYRDRQISARDLVKEIEKLGMNLFKDNTLQMKRCRNSRGPLVFMMCPLMDVKMDLDAELTSKELFTHSFVRFIESYFGRKVLALNVLCDWLS